MFPSSFHVSLPSIDQFKHNPIREDKKNKGGQKKNNQIRTSSLPVCRWRAIDDTSVEIFAPVCRWTAQAET
jgi:hypothetical protein